MAKKQFKSESKRLLDLMINSIYTHREIFLRELISNASDAIDKLCYISLTDENVGLSRDDFKIEIKADRDARTLTISDNGIGMTSEELESNLGVIAKSGSLQFKQEMAEKAAQSADESPETIDIIGQFGVGFYSSFMVASRVAVTTRAYGSDTAYKWESSGSDGYTITPAERGSVGTDIVLTLKPDTDGEDFSEYLEEYEIHSLVKKYSDYIPWPIVMDVTKSRKVEHSHDHDHEHDHADHEHTETEWEDYTELETLNSRVPLWQRPKSEVTDEECYEFFKEEFGSNSDPVSVVRVDAEGTVSYRAMLFIPSQAPYDYFSREYEQGLKLYASGVMIMERCAELVPEYFRFVRGIVDSQDLSLNISREMLQHDRQLRVIASNIEKKIKSELLRLLEKEPEQYAKFFKEFGLQLKYGAISDYGANRDNLRPLLMFYSSREGKLISLDEYAKNMSDGQPYAYFACGESASALDKLPQTELLRERGWDILYLTDDIDDFVMSALGKITKVSGDESGENNEIELRSVGAEDLGLQTDDERRATEESEETYRDLLDFVKDSLGGKIAAARFARTLKSAPACLTAQGGVTLEMERYFATVRTGIDEPVKAERVLELNEAHPVFTALRKAYATDKDRAAKYVELLYDVSVLAAGMTLDDAARLGELVGELMV
jgi:molecular chaperone HtpG